MFHSLLSIHDKTAQVHVLKIKEMKKRGKLLSKED
jgi:hypothetical protein